MTAEIPDKIIISRRFAFPIERVFNAWLDRTRHGWGMILDGLSALFHHA